MNLEIPNDVILRPCPLCGSNPLLKTNATVNSRPQYWLKCQNSDCGFSPAAAYDQQVAITRWNTLPLEESMDKENKACRSGRRMSEDDLHKQQSYDYIEGKLDSLAKEGKMEKFFCPEDGKTYYRPLPHYLAELSMQDKDSD